MRRLVAGLALTLAMLTLPAPASADPLADESGFVTRINALRAGQGLPALEVHPNLVEKARGWAATMAAEGRIWHSKLSDGITADWRKLGENVGMGGAVVTLHQAFVSSPKHYENLIDPDFGYVGIGVVHSGDTLFVSEMFMKLADTPVGAPPPPAPAPPAPQPPAPQPPAPQPPAPQPPAPQPPAPAPVPEPALAPEPAPAPGSVQVAAAPADEPPPAPSPLLISVLTRLQALGV